MFKGVGRTKLSLLVPDLEPDYVAERIIAAIRQDEEVVMIPWFLNVLLLLRSLVPVSTFDWLNYVLGASSSMDNF